MVERGHLEASDGLVAVQLATMAALLAPGRPRWALPAPLRALAKVGFGVGLAVSLLGAGQLGTDLTVRVDPREDAPLQVRGIYRVSRNPVYLGILIMAGALVGIKRRPDTALLAAGLAGVLHVKVGLEERSLLARYGSRYAEYLSGTPRLLGWPRSVS
jgi:protein-S-isoprenylcysteine O-methyltransferase Ste14